MKFIKLFNEEKNYLDFRNGSGYSRPNVSVCEGNKEVYYNYPPPSSIIYNYVDFGFPSGTLWATQNVGASKPSEAGLYFQWGDTIGCTADQVGMGEGQKKFATDFSDYKWGKSPNFSKYSTTGGTLELEDDAAHIWMGGNWHMPTKEQIEELTSRTTSAWTTNDGVSGVTFTSYNDSSTFIFIPAHGGAYDGKIDDTDTCFLRISTKSEKTISTAYRLGVSFNYCDLYDGSGCYLSYGFPVRGVMNA